MAFQKSGHSWPWIQIALLLCVVSVSLPFAQASYKKGVRLTDVQVLTLYNDRWTSGSQRIPQLQCTGGSAGCQKTPAVVQCRNMGSDGFDVQWKCEADMHKSVKFGRIEVSCEGLTRPDDPYVVKDSCGLEYTLELVDGKARESSSYSPAFVLIAFIVMAVLWFSCSSMFNGRDQQPRSQHHARPSAPPPYSASSAPPPPGFKTHYAGYTGDSDIPRSSNDGPGFWSGLMTGGGLGYLYGRSQPSSTTYRPSASYDSFGTSRCYSNDSAGNSNDGETHRSTGYGGTKRR